MRRSFRGKWCVVTGGGSGIGRETALALARRGAHLAILDKEGDSVARVGREIRDLGSEVLHYEVDVGDRDAFESVAQEIEETTGGVTLLVNNAGVLRLGGFQESTLSDYQKLLEVNLLAAIQGCQLFVPSMIERGDGAVVNVASVAGVVGFAPLSAYSTSKFGLVGFSQALRAELSRKGVSVGIVCPGLVRTEIATGANLPKERVEALQELLRKRGVSPRKIAETLISGAERGRGLILPDRQAWALGWVQRFFPSQASIWLARVAES